MVSRAGVWRTEGFGHIVGDNGAWADYQAGRDFDENAYDRFLEWIIRATLPRSSYGVIGILDWLVLPDIVAAGHRSLDLSIRYMNRCLCASELVLIAVQDGMEDHDLAPLVGPSVGIFLGGSTSWKLETAIAWGRFCAERSIYYHFARANSIKRIALAAASGAHSFDGSSASRYAVTTSKLTFAAQQPDLWSPR